MFLLLAPAPVAASAVVVTSSADDGAGSLRQAIETANADPGLDTISFNIPGCGPEGCIIQLQSRLPTITGPTIIDGYTQPGASPNTMGQGDNAVLRIVLNGEAILPFGDAIGLHVAGGDSTIRGLVINGFLQEEAFTAFGAGIFLDSEGNTVQGNFLGTDVTGGAAVPNLTGVRIGDIFPEDYRSGNTIGGPAPADRNVVSANTGGIEVYGDDNAVQGNYVGTDPSGMTAVPNIDGIAVAGGENNLIGGVQPGAGNLISGNQPLNAGLILSSPDGPNYVKGNLIGTNVTGQAPLPNTTLGVWIMFGDGQVVGGPEAGAANVISGSGAAMFIGSGENVIQGNFIGTDLTGSIPIPNGSGISFLGAPGGAGNLIGGEDPSEANMIAHNDGPGISVQNGNAAAVLRNAIFANTGLGIDLRSCNETADRITINDDGDEDTGASGLQNFPIITSASSQNGAVSIQGSLSSAPSTEYRLEFFANDTVHPTGYGPGQTYIGSANVTTNGAGLAAFDLPFPVSVTHPQAIRATATNLDTMETSEFSSPFGQVLRTDYGDAPDPFPTTCADDGARHVYTNGLHLGGAKDDEPDGAPSAAADGDDTDGDDEDGVIFDSTLAPGTAARLLVTASSQAFLDAWLDFNGDNDWDDAGEQVFTSRALSPGENTLIFTVPSTAATQIDTYARFRLSSAGGLSYDGLVGDGEVEDYAVHISAEGGLPGLAVIWGDNDCSNAAGPPDSLLALLHAAARPTDTGDCPDIGQNVDVQDASQHTWGDVDCSGAIDADDAVAILAHIAGLPSQPAAGCLQIGATVIVVG